MKQMQITVSVTEYPLDELSAERRELVELARKYTHNSYAPYSHFCVGAAIRLDNGEIVCGANQENAAFPSGTCAERSACYSAGARFPGAAFECIAIAARGVDGEPTAVPCAPCGACRQALLEYETLAGHDVEVILVGRDKVYVLPSVKSLLPLAFTDLG